MVVTREELELKPYEVSCVSDPLQGRDRPQLQDRVVAVFRAGERGVNIIDIGVTQQQNARRKDVHDIFAFSEDEVHGNGAVEGPDPVSGDKVRLRVRVLGVLLQSAAA